MLYYLVIDIPLPTGASPYFSPEESFNLAAMGTAKDKVRVGGKEVTTAEEMVPERVKVYILTSVKDTSNCLLTVTNFSGKI